MAANLGEKIACVSYAQSLSEELAFDRRKLMQTDWYRSVFTGTHLNPKKCNSRVLETTKGGQRRTTSVEGALTGLGGDFVIMDDPYNRTAAHRRATRAGQ